jgi:hypothetical protein
VHCARLRAPAAAGIQGARRARHIAQRCVAARRAGLGGRHSAICRSRGDPAPRGRRWHMDRNIALRHEQERSSRRNIDRWGIDRGDTKHRHAMARSRGVARLFRAILNPDLECEVMSRNRMISTSANALRRDFFLDIVFTT